MVDIGHIASRVQTPLTGLVTSSDTDFPVVSTSGFVAPCAVLVGHEDAWHDPAQTYVPELVWITTVVDGTTLRCVLADRGISGTAVRSHDGTAGDLVVTQVLDERNWERLREELDGVAKFETDTYTGDGTANRDIVLPFTPGFVAISWGGGGDERTAFSGAALGAAVRGLFIEAANVLQWNTPTGRPQLGAGKFTVSASGASSLNGSGVVYTYTAIGA